jgi:integrase
VVTSRATKRITAASLPKLYKTPGYHHDGGGLYLQVTANGGRSWVFRYMLDKRAREMGLGSADLWDLTSIRAKVLELKRLLLDGIDPIAARDGERRQRQQAAALARTFEECAVEYHQLNEAKWKNTKHASQFINTLRTYTFPTFGNWPVAEIQAADVVRALKPIWTEKSETATRVLQRVRTVLDWSATRKHRNPVPDGFWKEVATFLPHRGKKEAAHLAACPYQQVGTLLVAVRDSTASNLVKLAFVFTVLTAARSGEARGATWKEIDLSQAVWKLPKERMKAGRPHTVPLSTTAIDILRQARERSPKSELVFPSPKQRQLSDMVFTQLLRRLEAKVTMHGFRSSFRDWAAEQTSYPREVCEAALAHSAGDKTEAAYLRTEHLQKRRALMEDWAVYLEDTADRTGAGGAPA